MAKSCKTTRRRFVRLGSGNSACLCDRLLRTATTGLPLAPHNVCGPLGTMASAHVCASIPNFLVMEWHWIDYPGWDELTLQDQPVIQHGHVVLTDKPAIGLEVNDEVARHYVRPGTEYFGERP